MRNNPWQKTPENSPFILPEDKSVIESYNKLYGNFSDYRIQTHLLPEPFIGNPNSPVYLLGLNPGYADGEDDLWHKKLDFRRAVRENLIHKTSTFPFYFLDPRFTESPGGKWWIRKIHWIVEAVGVENTANNLFYLEAFPYHSRKFKPIPKRIYRHRTSPSFMYTRDLLLKHLESGKLVVIMRSFRLWYELVPELAQYSSILKVKNTQVMTLSPGNFVGFNKVVQLLKC